MIKIGYNYDMYILNPYIYGAGAAFANEKSILLDGVDEYVDLGSSTNITPNNQNEMSISFWYKFTAASGVQQMFDNYGGTSNFVRFGWWSNVLRGSVSNSTSGEETYSWTPTVGVWYHFVMTFDGTQANSDRISMYIDGSLVASTTVGDVGATTPDWTGYPTGSNGIGNRTSLSAYYANGNIDEFAIFDYELSSAQVTSIYNSGAPTDLDSTSGVTAPTHWWRMGDGSDTISTINDVGTTGGVNGTPTNMESGDIVTDVPT